MANGQLIEVHSGTKWFAGLIGPVPLEKVFTGFENTVFQHPHRLPQRIEDLQLNRVGFPEMETEKGLVHEGIGVVAQAHFPCNGQAGRVTDGSSLK
jgi:hypothetical protein